MCVLVCTCTENARKYNCVCWFGHVQKTDDNRTICVGLDMYREWKEIELYVLVWTCRECEKIELYVLVWTCTENGSK